MAIQTLKIGTSVQVKNSSTRGKITKIENGRYRIGRSNKWHSAGDLVADKITPPAKARKPIKRISALTKVLQSIYQILRFEYLLHNKLCLANLPGCTGAAKQIHHRYKRTGFWLIISKYFCPICPSCHNHVTKHSAQAIAAGISISRTANLSYDFCKRELELIKEHGISPP